MLPQAVLANTSDEVGEQPWTTARLHEALRSESQSDSVRTTERLIQTSRLLPDVLTLGDVLAERQQGLKHLVADHLVATAKQKRLTVMFAQIYVTPWGQSLLMVNDRRGSRYWLFLNDALNTAPNAESDALLHYLKRIVGPRRVMLFPHDQLSATARDWVALNDGHDMVTDQGGLIRFALTAYPDLGEQNTMGNQATISSARRTSTSSQTELSHLDRLEAESIHIMREVMAYAENPVMLYSIGKDSAVMLHLARKAFYPGVPPFPLLHVDTRWKFQEMYRFRDRMAKESGMNLIVHVNSDGVKQNINPFDHGSALHTDIMKTEGLKQALDEHRFDVAFGGARRDEEKSRAKERVFSFRTDKHRWDPKNQRPELWNLYNGSKRPGESVRVFPISNWTELDIWQYIYRENIPIVPLYFAAERPIVDRDGMLIMVDDDRMQILPGESIETRRVRFRTLGCYPLTGAIDSAADDLPAILLELLESKTSERQGRAIDSDSAASMEKKKQEGYF